MSHGMQGNGVQTITVLRGQIELSDGSLEAGGRLGERCFLAGLLDTEDYALALRLGTACGSATAYSACLASRDMIEAVLPAVEITTL